MPDRWWDLTSIYLYTNLNNIERNNKQWGRILTLVDRHSLTSEKVLKYQIKNANNSFEKAREFRKIIHEINKLKNGECLEIFAKNREYNSDLSNIQILGRRSINFLINVLDLPFKIRSVEYYNDLMVYNLDSISDTFYLLWQLVIKDKVGDYLIIENNDIFRARITKKL